MYIIFLFFSKHSILLLRKQTVLSIFNSRECCLCCLIVFALIMGFIGWRISWAGSLICFAHHSSEFVINKSIWSGIYFNFGIQNIIHLLADCEGIFLKWSHWAIRHPQLTSVITNCICHLYIFISSSFMSKGRKEVGLLITNAHISVATCVFHDLVSTVNYSHYHHFWTMPHGAELKNKYSSSRNEFVIFLFKNCTIRKLSHK